MPQEPSTGRSSQDSRSTAPRPGLDVRSSSAPVSLSPDLTPNGLFTNIFLVHLPHSLGAFRAAGTDKAQKEEFASWRRPAFYRGRDSLYAFGDGLDTLDDRRFTSAIVTSETDRQLTKHLLRIGLMDFFRAEKYSVRGELHGFTVHDHKTVIESSAKGFLHIVPQFTFQPYWVECTGGSVRFAFAIEPGTTTLPTFHLMAGLQRVAPELQGVKLQLERGGCRSGCPLHGKKGRIVGRFAGFADQAVDLDCTCHEESFDPVPIRVLDRRKRSRRQEGGNQLAQEPEYDETELVLPGQILGAAPGQRRLLRLTNDSEKLERAGRQWLGDLSADGKVRGNALRVRYERLQEFLSRVAGDATKNVAFALPTGVEARIERLPLTVEELSDVS